MPLLPILTPITRRRPVCVLALWSVLAMTAVGTAQAAPSREALLRVVLKPLIQTGGVAVGGPGGGGAPFLFGEGSYTPASIIKLATAGAAIDHLGVDYRFRTEFFLDGERNLYLRGWGDPLMVSEEWLVIAEKLRAMGALQHPFQHLYLDDSAIPRDLEVDGAANSTNPYDARMGALVSNFNTIFVKVAPDGSVTSAEAQTPLTPSAREMAASLPTGRHRINFSRRRGAGLRYTGELARAFLQAAGARFEGRVRVRKVPSGLKPLLVHRSSKSLQDVVRGMMEFSNNFIANQIVLGLALESRGAPASLNAGLEMVRKTLTGKIGLVPGRFHLEEGSGLSRKNSIRLVDMLRVTEAFRPWRELLRTHGKAPNRSYAKTGTLKGVYSLAGFLPGEEGARRAFVIILNQPRNTRAAVFRRLMQAYAGR